MTIPNSIYEGCLFARCAAYHNRRDEGNVPGKQFPGLDYGLVQQAERVELPEP